MHNDNPMLHSATSTVVTGHSADLQPRVADVDGEAPTDDGRHWYAVKVLNNRVFAYEEYLRDVGVEYYFPTEERVVERDGQRKKKLWPVVPSLIFIHTDAETALRVVKESTLPSYVYSRIDSRGVKRPAPIPDRQMKMFILISSSGEKGLEFYDASELNLDVGHRVRVIDGIFRGAEGYIKRIKGNRRFVVAIDGVCCVATHYIPVAFLQKI